MIEPPYSRPGSCRRRGRPKGTPQALTRRDFRAIENYLSGEYESAVDALRAAGYTTTSALKAKRWLGRPAVASEVERIRAIVREKTAVDVARTVKELARIAFSDVRQLFESDHSGWKFRSLVEVPEDTRRAIARFEIKRSKDKGTITTTVKLWNKVDALNQLMRHLGGYEKDNAQKSNFENLTQEELAARRAQLEVRRAELEILINGKSQMTPRGSA